MRRLLVTTVTLCALLLAAAGPASAKGAPETLEFSFDFVNTNPCTGETAVWNVDLTGKFHAFEVAPANRHHANIVFSTWTTTSDGFYGREVGRLIDDVGGNLEAVATGNFEHFGFTTNLRNDDGQRIKQLLVFQFRRVGGEVVVEFERFAAWCAGKPAERRCGAAPQVTRTEPRPPAMSMSTRLAALS